MSEASEPTDNELFKIEDRARLAADTGGATPYTALRAGRRAVFRAGAASQPTAAEVAATIVARVRANCTLDWDIVQKGGDHIVYGVADWIENPPEWVDAPWAERTPVQVVPDPPKLDPFPWVCHDEDEDGALRLSRQESGCDVFEPEPQFSQDRTAYGLPTEEQR